MAAPMSFHCSPPPNAKDIERGPRSSLRRFAFGSLGGFGFAAGRGFDFALELATDFACRVFDGVSGEEALLAASRDASAFCEVGFDSVVTDAGARSCDAG